MSIVRLVALEVNGLKQYDSRFLNKAILLDVFRHGAILIGNKGLVRLKQFYSLVSDIDMFMYVSNFNSNFTLFLLPVL